MKTTLIVIFALSFFCCVAQPEAILDKYFHACGGRTVIEKITTVHSTHLFINYSGKKDTLTVKTIEKSPWFISAKTYQKFRTRPDYEYFGNEKGVFYKFWFPFPMSKTLERNRVDLSTAHHLLRAMNEHRIKLVEDDTVLHRSCFAIKTTFRKTGPNETNHIYFFDKESGLLVASSSVALEGDTTYYEDYRSVDGFLFPFRMEYYLHNTLISRTEYKELSLNREVDNSIFYPSEKDTERSLSSKFNKIEYLNPKQGNESLAEFMLPFRGKTILVDLWATWCAPCKAEFTRYDSSFYQFLNDNQVEMVFISYDNTEKTKAWKKDVAAFNVNGYHIMAGPKLKQSINNEIYQGETNYIPRYFLVSIDGKILSRNVPKPSSPDFNVEIDRLLEKDR